MTNTIAEFIIKEIEKLNTSIKTFENHLVSFEQNIGLTDEIDRMYSARIKGRIDTLQMMRDMYQLLLPQYEALKQQERNKAKWIEDGYNDEPCVCSKCGQPGQYEWLFCPNCGAEMMEE